MNRLSMLTMMSICKKMKTNRVCYQPITTPQVVLIFIIALHLCDLNNNIKPESTEDGLTLQRTHKTKEEEEEEQIFLVFTIFQTSQQSKNKQSKNKPNKAKSFWIFCVFEKAVVRTKKK